MSFRIIYFYLKGTTQLGIDYWKVKNHIKKFLPIALEDLKASRRQLDFSKGIENRLYQYALFHGIFGTLLCNLHGRSLHKVEFERLLYLSICAPLFDDLSDFWQVNENDISLLLKGQSVRSMPEIASHYALIYLNKILSDLSSDSQSKFQMLLEALIHENNQSDDSRKGEISALMFRLLINEQINQEEKEIVIMAGRIGQFIDDIFDLFEDRMDNKTTMATKLVYISLIEQKYKALINTFLIKIIELNKEYYIKLSKPILAKYCILLATPFVALDQYSKHLDETGQLPMNLHRNAFICDMDLKYNQFKLLAFGYKLYQQVYKS